MSMNMPTYWVDSICRHIHGHLYLPIIRSSFISTQYVDIFMNIYIFLLYVPHLYLLNMSAYSWTSISSYYTFLIYIDIDVHEYADILSRYKWGTYNRKILMFMNMSTYWVDINEERIIGRYRCSWICRHIELSTYSWTSISSYYTFLIYIYSICRHIDEHLYLPIIRSSFISTQYVGIFMK
jgi:hypothetical protein